MLAAINVVRRLTLWPALRYVLVALAFAAYAIVLDAGVVAGGPFAVLLALAGSLVAGRRAVALRRASIR